MTWGFMSCECVLGSRKHISNIKLNKYHTMPHHTIPYHTTPLQQIQTRPIQDECLHSIFITVSSLIYRTMQEKKTMKKDQRKQHDSKGTHRGKFAWVIKYSSDWEAPHQLQATPAPARAISGDVSQLPPAAPLITPPTPLHTHTLRNINST